MAVTAAKKKTVGVMDLNDILAGAEVSKETKSKSKVPVLDIPENVRKLVSVVRALKEELDSVKSIYETKEKDLIDLVLPEREKYCMQHGYVSSLKVESMPDKDQQTYYATLSWKHAYTKIGIDNAQTIEEIIGPDRYSQFFETDMTITVKDISETSLTELIQLVGPEKFAKFFEVERNIKPTERYTNEIFTAFTPEQRQKLSPYVKQYKPALRTK